MSSLEDYYRLTRKLVQLAETWEKSKDQDQSIVQIEAILEDRQLLLKHIIAPNSEEEKQLSKKLLEEEKNLNEKLTTIRHQIGEELQAIRKKKTYNNKYMNSYNNISTDGFFYDKKK
ncbi:flagellar protein FliT [Peribacillus saganii]|uniref:Flagellar protein FliT n=1 Tax=Peribacillus saganii TaxID=2303992 RepID=A0A372LNR3_9BACI|nr:flagellar protein FliT [Peribacillus saganii]RFU69336.1 flagellar protein FliT [Peribacillus saganii]